MAGVFDLKGDGFTTVFKSDSWRIACITYADMYSKEGFNHMKRHLTTDEVFVLLRGNAVMHTIEDGKKVSLPLEPEKVYCVYKNTWHYLEISEDALLVVAEDSQMPKGSTQRLELS